MGVALVDYLEHGVAGEWNLRQQDCIGTAGHTPARAIQPACRPMTLITVAHWCDDAVVCSPSIASHTREIAASMPSVRSVEARSLSMFFGTPTMSIALSWSLLQMLIVPSPPMAINASRLRRLGLRIASYDMS